MKMPTIDNSVPMPATIIGAITGGGIGLMLTQAMITQKDWEEVTYYILLVILLVFATVAVLVAGLVPGMLARGRGSVVNVTSMVASKGVPGASGYSASKAALESLTRTWAAEFGSKGVRVNSVAPGPTRTEGVAAEWGETNEELGRALPLGRTAHAAEIAEAVLFLASPRASFITGSTLHADGGGAAV